MKLGTSVNSKSLPVISGPVHQILILKVRINVVNRKFVMIQHNYIESINANRVFKMSHISNVGTFGVSESTIDHCDLGISYIKCTDHQYVTYTTAQ